MDISLEHIIRECQQGKRHGQKKLYDRFCGRLLGVSLRYSSNVEEAEDVLHDSFIKIFDKIDQYKFKGSFEGWMRRIVVNTALEIHRSRNKIINIQDNIKETITEGSYEYIIESLTADELMQFVMELSPKYRLVFNMYAIDGYSHQEIAQKLGISVGTSKSNLSRARNILQEKIKNQYSESINLGNLKQKDEQQ